VEVEEGQQVAGEPTVKLTGVLDTSAMVEGMLARASCSTSRSAAISR
jgi:hypothetical protein